MVKNSKRRMVFRFKSRHRRSKSPQDTDTPVSGGTEGVMNSARQKLKGALQDLMPHSDDDSSSDDDSRHHWNSAAIKRARREVSGSTGRRHGATDKGAAGGEGFRNSFIMKLFDRTVDLSNYTESTPLYPICRAWIANSSLYSFNRKLDELKEEVKNSIDDGEPSSDVQKSGGITRLPSPTHRMDDGEKLRVPKPIVYISNYPNVSESDDCSPSREDLLSDNLAHWTKVRQSWRDASKHNEQRYSESIKLLTNMFNTQ